MEISPRPLVHGSGQGAPRSAQQNGRDAQDRDVTEEPVQPYMLTRGERPGSRGLELCSLPENYEVTSSTSGLEAGSEVARLGKR